MRTERFNKAYDALVKAFFEGTLNAGICTSCAVGSIVREAGFEQALIKRPGVDVMEVNSDWGKVFKTMGGKQEKNFTKFPNICAALKQATGYSAQELAEVEYAFEINARGIGGRTGDQFKGLCAVVDVLLKLDNITPEDHYKNKFREHPQLIY